MTILGIDPGYAICGFGLIYGDRSKQQLIQYGAIRTEAGRPLPERLKQIYDDVTLLINQFNPQMLAIEELFFHTNVTTALSVAHARGVIVLAAETLGIPVYEYTPLQVKLAIAGYGRADKAQMMDMVRRHLNLKENPKPDDAADALAVALCHMRSATSLINMKKR